MATTSSIITRGRSRKCQFCGRVFEARQEQVSGTFYAADTRNRMQPHRNVTVEAMSAAAVRTLHEDYDCERNPKAAENRVRRDEIRRAMGLPEIEARS